MDDLSREKHGMHEALGLILSTKMRGWGWGVGGTGPTVDFVGPNSHHFTCYHFQNVSGQEHSTDILITDCE